MVESGLTGSTPYVRAALNCRSFLIPIDNKQNFWLEIHFDFERLLFLNSKYENFVEK